jgi:hypothetical protein
MASIDLIQAIAATAELCGTNLSEGAAKLLLADLSEYDERGVLVALTKCRKELKGRLTLAEIISRIDDGRPGAEEAWSMLPRDEATTVVWTGEMTQAWGGVQHLIDEDELVAARMAFKETYYRLVTEARELRTPVKWSVSLGHDVAGRKTALLMAVAKRRITADHACALIPNFEVEDSVTPLLEAAKVVGVIGLTHALTFHPYAQGD